MSGSTTSSSSSDNVSGGGGADSGDASAGGSGGDSGGNCDGYSGAIISITYDCDGNLLTKEEKQAKLLAIYKSAGWKELKEEIIKYNEIREKVIHDMENHPDPIFQDFLKFYKCSLGPEVFERNRLKIYAICNKQAMCRCLPIDEIVKHNHIAIETNMGQWINGAWASSSSSSSEDEED